MNDVKYIKWLYKLYGSGENYSRVAIQATSVTDATNNVIASMGYFPIGRSVLVWVEYEDIPRLISTLELLGVE